MKKKQLIGVIVALFVIGLAGISQGSVVQVNVTGDINVIRDKDGVWAAAGISTGDNFSAVITYDTTDSPYWTWDSGTGESRASYYNTFSITIDNILSFSGSDTSEKLTISNDWNYGSGTYDWFNQRGSGIPKLNGSEWNQISLLLWWRDPTYSTFPNTNPPSAGLVNALWQKSTEGLGNDFGRIYTGGNDWDMTLSVQNVDAVPIPGAVWLLGSGLIGLVGLRRKLKK